MKNISIILFASFLCLSGLFSQDWEEIIKTVASDGHTGDNFGYSVAVSGDYAIVGAVLEDEDGNGENTLGNAGSAYIFHFNGTRWMQEQKIVPSDREATDYFGCSVAISGDYIVVGAYSENEDASASNTLDYAGSAYIFHFDGAEWIQQQKIVASNREAGWYFGHSVAISGDYIVVGSPYDTKDVENSNYIYHAGAAYIFLRSGSTWSMQQKIVDFHRKSYNEFGYDVAISGNYIIVGSYLEDTDANGGNEVANSGSASIFYSNGSSWSPQQKIVSSNRKVGGNFGYSVDISDDVAIVGAWYEDLDANGENLVEKAGAAYVFSRSGSIWSEQQKIVASDRTRLDNFGNSVAISDEYIMVATHFESKDSTGGISQSCAGAVFVFKQNASIWTQEQKLVASDRSAQEKFGRCVAMDGDIAMIGAVNESAYIFEYDANVGIENSDLTLLQEFGLQKIYPNPFNPEITINYSLLEEAHTTLLIYNMRGQLIEILYSGLLSAGSHTQMWHPKNISTGMYIVQLQSSNNTSMQKIVYVK